MKQPEPIVINNFQKGIAESPVFGFEDMRNLDIYTVPGAVRTNIGANLNSSTTITGLSKWLVRNPASGYLYALSDDGKVWTNSSGSWAQIAGNTTTNCSGNGLGLWKDYLFVARNSVIDVYGPLSSSPAWTSAWNTFGGSDSHWHPFLNGQDDILYIGDGRYVASLLETSGSTFAPGTGASFTYTQKALTLPAQYRVKCLAESGRNLLVGTIIGTSDWGGVVGGDIFPWDRVSSSFNLPIRLNEFGIHQMTTIGNVTYIIAGTQGSIYSTIGGVANLLRKIPNTAVTLENLRFDFYPGAVTNHLGRVYFGVSRGSASNAYSGMGVWSVSADGRLVFEHQISTGNMSSSNALKIGSVISTAQNQIYIGWQDNASYGVDVTDSSSRYASYAGYFVSQMFEVGTPNNRRSFGDIMFQLDRPMASGEGVVLKYRKARDAAWTTIGTFDYATYGAIQSFRNPSGIFDAEFVQIRCEITNAATPFNLKQIILE